MTQATTDYTYEADELELFIENEERLYHSQFVPICKNVQRRMAKGTYDSAKAVKLFMYLVDRGARMYCAEHGGSVRSMFPKECRLQVTASIRDGVEAEIKATDGGMF